MKERRQRILFISHDASITGAPIFLSNLLKSLKCSTRYDLAVHFANDGPLVDVLKQDGLRVITFKKILLDATFPKRWFHRFKYYLKFIALLVEFKPDLVYSNTMSNFAQVILARLLGIRTLVHMHEGMRFASAQKLGLIFASLFTTRYVAGSKYVADVLKSITGADGVVIYNGIKAPPLSQGTSPKNTEFLLSVIGSIDRNKAQLVAVQAVEHLLRMGYLGIQLKIIGQVSDPAYAEELEAYVNSNAISPFVTFLGHVETIEDAYRQTDVLIVPSMDEAFPTVVLEAMAFQKPVIASNTGGIPEIVKDEVTGLLFEPGDFVALADKILLLLNEDLRQTVVKNAYLNIGENYSFDETRRRIVQTIDGTLGNRCAETC